MAVFALHAKLCAPLWGGLILITCQNQAEHYHEKLLGDNLRNSLKGIHCIYPSQNNRVLPGKYNSQICIC